MNVDPKDRSFWFWFFLVLTALAAWPVFTSSPEPSIVALFKADSAEAVEKIFGAWGEAGRAQAVTHVRWDFLFTFAYVGFLLAATWRYTRHQGRWLVAFGRSLMAVPLVTGLFDVVENFLILDVLRFADPAGPLPEETVVATTWVAWIKFCLPFLTLCAIFDGLRKRHRINEAKGWRSLTAALSDDVVNGGLSPEEEPLAWEGEEGAHALERHEIRRSRKELGRSDDLDADPPIGLSFSGGGIRSATFSLGFLQALAKRGGLKCIDYLSVVSGGGYIGSWLSKWIAQAKGVDNVQAELQACCNGAPETPQLSFLRRYSNYLTPRTGLFSADTWTTVATYLRNFLLNQVILAAGALTLLLLPRLLAGLFDPERLYLRDEWPWWCLVIGGLLAFWALVGVGFNLAHFDRSALDEKYRRFTSQGWIITRIAGSLAVTALLGSYWLHRVTEDSEPEWLLAFERSVPLIQLDRWPDLVQWVVFSAVLYSGCWAISQLASWFVGRGEEASPSGRLSAPRLILWALPAGAAGGFLLALAQLVLAAHEGGPLSPEGGASIWKVIVFGPPVVILVLLAAAVIHIGLMGTHLQTGRREWMARLGGWLLIFAGSWVVFAGVAVYGPVLIAASGTWLKTGLASGWVASTIGGILAGRSSKNTGEEAKGGKLSGLVTKVVPYVFIVGLITLLALALDLILVKAQVGHSDASDQQTERLWEKIWPEEEAGEAAAVDDCCLCVEPGCVEASPGWGEKLATLTQDHNELLETQARTAEPLVFCVLFALICILMARRVDINEYSMHHFYRNRLTRCYLGASTRKRAEGAQLFTGFNPKDDVPLSSLATLAAEGEYAAPYLIVNTALNLVHDNELAWQQRQAASFVMTPLHCGFELPGGEDDGREEDRTGPDTELPGPPKSFRRSTVYAADRRRDLSKTAERAVGGLGLGTAMAISGAAVSPNMGYHSSPALTFLLTVFNVRLGWWLGNPGDKRSWRYAGPRFGLFHLLSELFGLTSSSSDYVYLSDGGHFENLGLYELVRRRCKVIIACDCGADLKRKFADLGNAVRKCRVDQQTDIRFEGPIDRFEGPIDRSKKGRPWALGTIHYPDCDPGTLILVKPTLRPNDPEDVRSYGAVNDDFPQQSTGDQWFDESQFESYRMLGYTIGKEVFPDGVDECDFVGPLKAKLAAESATGDGDVAKDGAAEASEATEGTDERSEGSNGDTGGGESEDSEPDESAG